MSRDVKIIAELGLGSFDMLADDIEPAKLAEEIGILLIDAGIAKDEGTRIGEIAIEAFNNAPAPDEPSKFSNDEIYVEMLRQLNENRNLEGISESPSKEGFVKGKHVKHPKFGTGVIVEEHEKNDGIVCIDFEAFENKWVLVEYANMSILE